MPRTEPFDHERERYERWFEMHRAAYLSELLAVRAFLPWRGIGLEIGVGTGRFAAPLGIRVGVDPSPAMLEVAAARGIETVEGTAEDLPFPEGSFDHVLVVTTICFVDSPERMVAEARRVLRPGGRLVVGLVDRLSPLGSDYLDHQEESVFYRDAVFFSADEVVDLLAGGGFVVDGSGQTLFRPLSAIDEIEPLLPGTGRGSFVVITAARAGS